VPALLPFDSATLARLATAGALPFLPAAAFVRIQPSSMGTGFEVAPLVSPSAPLQPTAACDAAAVWNASPPVDENQNSKRRQSDDAGARFATGTGSHCKEEAARLGAGVDAAVPRLPHTADQNLIVLALAAAAQHRKELEEAGGSAARLQPDLAYSQDAEDDSDDGDPSTAGATHNGFVGSVGGRHHPRVRSMIAGEHRQTLKEFYRVNPRPSKAELEQLLARISFPKRVVQVWFQNMRARDRRKARIAAAAGPGLQRPATTAVRAGPPVGVGAWIKAQDEPLDLSRRDARPPPTTSAEQQQSVEDEEEEEQALNLSVKRRRCDDDDEKMEASSPADSDTSVKSEWSADNDDTDTQLDLLANGSLNDVSITLIPLTAIVIVSCIHC